MVISTSIAIPPEKEADKGYIEREALRSVRARVALTDSANNVTQTNKVTPRLLEGAEVVIAKKSIDARHGRTKIVLKCDVYIGEKPPSIESALPQWIFADGKHTVVIVGSGPAGLFGALTLLEKGIKSVIIERGEQTGQRKADIAGISRAGKVNADSNYCFGEGGAGTFSDGKLYTRSDKRGNLPLVLKIFNHFGADKNILTDAHPHIGTDRLPQIVNAMRQRIIELGGEFMFNTRCTDILFKEDLSGAKTVTGVRTANTKTGKESEVFGEAVLLATGHSAVDIYQMIARISPNSLEAKGFAVGVRVEHPRKIIDNIQFHGDKRAMERFGAAEYRLTSQQDGRGVYTFCMCPGGFVVPSATAPNQTVVNGMSTARRNSAWSNAAAVVETRAEDIPSRFADEAKKMGCPALSGLLWRTWLEEETYSHGDAQKAPAQRLEDFLRHRESASLPPTSYAPGISASRLDEWLPERIASRLAKGFCAFGKQMRGFVCPEALIIAAETRTSTPVRILRDIETGECKGLSNLYPAGEGSGYSGGIASSAMDGIRQCSIIAQKLAQKP